MEPATVPAIYMHGGTSKALFFHDKDVPPHGPKRDRFLMRVMGSPDPMQIDGMGGTYPVTSKVAVIRPSEREDADVNFLFAQVSVKESFVDWDAGCGNISSGVGPFAINEGLVKEKRLGSAAEGYTTQETTGGGVDKGLLPTGNPTATMSLDGKHIEYTICDAAHIIAFAHAHDFGLKGDDHPRQINEDQNLLDKIRKFRGQAAYSVGMCRSPETVDQDSPILPMIALLSNVPDGQDGHVQSRLFLDGACHSAMAGAGATCTAAASRVEGSLVDQVMRRDTLEEKAFKVLHPGGVLPISIEVDGEGQDGMPTFGTLSFVRTARYLFKGELFVPEDLEVEFGQSSGHA